MLRVKLAHLDDDNNHRCKVGQRYIDNINNPLIRQPKTMYEGGNVFHLFPVFCERRDELQQYLHDNNVQTLIHYPIPPHKQECYSDWSAMPLPITEQLHRQELSLPISQVMTLDEADEVVRLVNRFK